MKTSKLFIFLLLIWTSLVSAAHADLGRGPLAPEPEQAIRATLESCLVRPYGIRPDGERILGHYRSTCRGVIRDGRSALVPLSATGGPEQGWEVQLIGSQYSDGGDLWDLAVWDDQGHLVLEADRVLAFGDPLEALAIITGAHPQSMLHDAELDELQ